MSAAQDLGPLFDGRTFSARLDHSRLSRQLVVVRELMLDGRWRTLAEISMAVGEPEASVSARLRDLRKEKFGGYEVGRRRKGEAGRGVHEYRVTQGAPQ